MPMRHALVAVVLLVSVPAALIGDAAGDARIQQAIDLIERKGDFAGAAALLDEAARSSDRSVAARALFHLAYVQERQGQDAARTTYTRIATEFRDQREVADEARQRLAALDADAPSSVPRQAAAITGEDADSAAFITPDGRFLSRTDWGTGDIVVRDLRTGRAQHLLQKTAFGDSWAESPIVAPDGTRVLYVWFDNDRDRYQVRVMPNTPGAPPEVLLDSPDYTWFEAIAWSPDSRRALVKAWTEDSQVHLIWVDVTIPTWKLLRSLGHRDGDGRYALSPDGKYLAFTMLATPRQRNAQGRWVTTGPHQHIYVLPTDGPGAEAALVTGTNINESPVWTPDGKHILFVSDRGWDDSFDLWSIAVENGRRASPEMYVGAHTIGRIRPLTMTRAGTYYYLPALPTPGAGRDIFVADLEPSTFRVVGAPVRLFDARIDANLAPAWSPDGERLAFMRGRPGSRDPAEAFEVVVQSRGEAGGERALPMTYLVDFPPIWLSDSRNLLVRRNYNGAQLVRWNTDTGETRSVESIVHSTLPVGWRAAALSRDDTVLYLVVADREPVFRLRIVAFDMTSAEERTIWTSPPCPTSGSNCYVGATRLVISPDGRSLAFTLRRSTDDAAVLILVPVDGSGHRELARGVTLGTPTWAPDGRYILVGRPAGNGAEVVRVSTATGVTTAIGLTMRGDPLHLDASGSRLVYADRTRDYNVVMAYENLLGLLK